MKLIPNSLYDVLVNYATQSPQAIKTSFDQSSHQVLDEYFAFLLKEGWGFMTSEPQNFPELDTSYRRPERIDNAIIDSDDQSQHDYRHLLTQLDGLDCRHLELRFFSPYPASLISNVLEATDQSVLRSVELILCWSEDLTDQQLDTWRMQHPRLMSILMHGVPQSRLKTSADSAKDQAPVRQTTAHIDGAHHCGVVHQSYFRAGLSAFTRAMNYNSCLYKKIAVDVKGLIRNCPSMPENFGKADEVSLSDALAHPEFAAHQAITKDQVAVCRDCEFRYVCTDCRAHTRGGIHDKPVRCSYNPYTATWEQPESKAISV